MKCPVCLDPDLLMTDREGIEIDYCPRCRGVWLDRGELDKIIERSTASLPPAAAYSQPSRDYDYDDDYDDDKRYQGDYPRKKKRGSFFEDLFDF